MPSYLLLRNNKESGPLSKEQLIELGLKPYDLIWVEGKSAAWRYAGEVPDLKDYAPIVEEQPYDRFYKKNSEEPKEQLQEELVSKYGAQPSYDHSYKKNVQEQQQQIEEEFSNKDVEEEKEQLNEKPFKRKKVETKETTPSLVRNQNGSVSVIMPKHATAIRKEEPVYVRKSEPAPILPEVPVEAETKYSVPLDEIKQKYVRQLEQRKQKTAQKKFLVKNLKRAALFAVIIGAGVLIGFAIKPGKGAKNNAINTEQTQPLVPTSSETLAKEETLPVANTVDASSTENTTDPLNNAGSEKMESKNTIIEKKPAMEKTEEATTNPITKPAVINPTDNERNKNVREEDPVDLNEKTIGASDNISELVSVKANKFIERDFGGFRNLQLTVSNDSKIDLDHVTVELEYLKFNGETIKIENIPFNSVPAGGSLTVRIPDNNRGAKLKYRIIKIQKGR